MQEEEYDFPVVLMTGIWHSTSPERYKKIIESKFILPEPAIPNNERWSTAKGKDLYPFVRSIGGVSIFDFRNFNVVEYSNTYSTSVWATFVPCRLGWDTTIWLELDEEKMNEDYLSPNEVMLKRSQANSYRQIIPYLEGAHIGSIPISYIKRIMQYCDINGEFDEIDVHAI